MAKRDNNNYRGSGKGYDKSVQRKEYARTLRNRQNYALENSIYRRKIEAINGRGGISTDVYRLPADVKKKNKDYFFVMRKFVCFLMFLLLLVCVAYFVLGYVKIDAIPEQYTALFMETEAKAEEAAEEDEDEAKDADVSVVYAADEETDGASEEKADGEEEKASSFAGTAYGVLDPIFGALKYWGAKLNVSINLGASPLYDSLISKYEVGMADSLAGYIILAFPFGLILYLIIALVMMIKAFIGMFGRRIVKRFGLGSLLMIVFGALTAFAGLAFTTDVAEKMNFGDILNLFMGIFNGSGGFTGGYGLILIIALPLLVLILSMFARKKVPYSIFDTFGE